MQIRTAGCHLPPAVERQLQMVQGWKVTYVCLMLALVSLALFKNLDTQIAAAVAPEFMLSNPDVVSSPLDTQLMYDTTSLVKTLTAWGPQGRAAFAAFEFVDLGLFFAAYSGLFLAGLNGIRIKLQQQQGNLVLPSLVRWGYVFVVLLLCIDLCEDSLQLLLCDTFIQVTPGTAASIGAVDVAAVLLKQPPWWRPVVYVCVVVHSLKGLLVGINLLVLMLGGVGILWRVLSAWWCGAGKRD